MPSDGIVIVVDVLQAFGPPAVANSIGAEALPVIACMASAGTPWRFCSFAEPICRPAPVSPIKPTLYVESWLSSLCLRSVVVRLEVAGTVGGCGTVGRRGVVVAITDAGVGSAGSCGIVTGVPSMSKHGKVKWTMRSSSVERNFRQALW